MVLKNISILNYKNIESADIELSPKINCFIGHNGAGKTNLLDAVYYMSFTKSAFNTRDSQIITHDRDFFVVEGTYEAENGTEEKIYCGMKRASKKQFRRNGKGYRRLSQHLGLIPLIFVSPSDSILIEGYSEERRRLMDVVISQYDHNYTEALIRYNKALAQRNALLRQEEEPDASLMDLLEEQMADSGTTVFHAREQFVEELTPVFQEIFSTISRDRETVALRYVSHAQRGSLIDVIRRDRSKDRAVGYSLHGIHRDDIEMTIGGYPMKQEGSQGQTKTFVISLKLAQFSFLRRTVSNTTPLLLLDDIFDKLDADRVEQIVNVVAGEEYGQIFMTDTNRENLDKILRRTGPDYKIFEVDRGRLTERKEDD